MIEREVRVRPYRPTAEASPRRQAAIWRTGSLMREPTAAVLERWAENGVAKALDGCRVEPDGHCPHGQPSWLLYLGVI